ncbi:MAG TPA: EAL domain-containing protein [Stellaceae bacterium]|jgi:diguanylate cyclase (GGDEF)-like protein|nr:EAL domain-containing protein [Stellaceae bacterium]
MAALAVTEALEAAGDAAYVWDLDDDRIDWSGRLAATGDALAAALSTGRALAGRIHPDDLMPRQHSLALHLDGSGPFDCEYRLRTADGGFAWLHERGQVERDGSGRVRRMLGVIRAVEDRHVQQSRIEQRASYDELTGHFNATRLREAVDRIIVDAQRGAQAAAFLAVGVDGMAAINDRYGAEAADTVLIEIGRRLDACLRVNDQVGRLGGDRFGVILPHCSGEHIGAAVGKILALVGATAVMTARGPVSASVSIGSTLFPSDGTTSYDVITRAEAALAEAKGAGRDRHVHYAADTAGRERDRLRTIGETVRSALREGRLVFAYQPVVSAETKAVDYYECLLHLRGEDGRIGGAGGFIPAIEQLGLIRLVDRYVLDRSIDEIAAHPGVSLGFNVSALTAADRPWLRALAARLRNDPGLASRIVVEITETAALYDIEESARFVSALRRAGCRVALDDFGAGHTSLRHLHSLAVDTVKIDGAFIRNLAESPENRVFLRHLIKLAAGFGFKTVAECVETAADASILREEGVDFLQGHYCGRPSFEPDWRLPPLRPLGGEGRGEGGTR